IDAPLLATNDSHYTAREDAVAHDALLCVQTGSTMDDPKRFKFEGDQHYLKTAAEMRHLFRDWPEACDNTLWIAERAEREIRVGPGRGSAAGCCVAYCLQIVDLDPIAYDLIFERFLNPGRKQMPDIDMDFDERSRSEMIRYAAERYGWDHVAQIVTFSTIKARAAVRDAARVLGYPYAVGDRIAKAMPPLVMGRDTPLYACLEKHPKYEDGYRSSGELR